MKFRHAAALAVSGALFLAACGDDSDDSAATTAAAAETTAAAAETTAAASEMPEASADIVDTAVAAGSFTTLAKLLTDAGLVDTLKGPGPFTVFAPTDDAFAAVPKETLDKIAADKALLTKVLTYHVVAGSVPSSAVTTGKVPSVEGSDIDVKVEDGKVMVNNATVVTADVMASNGVIHVIDSVILPPDLAL